MQNARIAELFDELAARLEVLGEHSFKARAYRTFADSVRELDVPLTTIAARGEIGRVAGAGKAIVQKVDELLARGTFGALERARAETPAGVVDLMRLPGVGAKTARALWEKVRITTVAELALACADDLLVDLPGFGAKKQENLRDAANRSLGWRGAGQDLAGGRAHHDDDPGAELDNGSVLLAMAREACEHITRTLLDAGAARVALVGDARRGLELVRTIEIIVSGLSTADIVRAIRADDDDLLVSGVAERARESEVIVALHARGVAHVHVVDDARFVGELVTRTGDEQHVRWLEDLAASHGGLAAIAHDAGREEQIYETLQIPFVPPELRGGPAPSVPAALVPNDGLVGVFHVHTDWSDGMGSIAAMARAASRAGYTYVGLSDHSKAASYARGLDADRLAAQASAVAAARDEVPEIAIFHGVEVDILPDGELDLDDDALAELDFVIASVHSSFAMTPEEMTARLTRAVSHPLVTMLGHPTGRLLQAKKGYAFDVAKVARAAAANDTALEINANAQRLDLSPPLIRQAVGTGARFCVNPDAHAPRGFHDTVLGTVVARRAGLENPQVLNTMPRETMMAYLAQRKARALRKLGREARPVTGRA